MRRPKGLAAAVAVALGCLAVPGAANAGWQDVGQTLRGDPKLRGSYVTPDTPQFDLKRIAGRLYLAWVSAAPTRTLYVDWLSDDGTRWEPFGQGPVNRDTTKDAQHPSLAAGPDGTPWIAWDETDADGAREIRVARFDEVSGTWVEPDGRDWEINRRYGHPRRDDWKLYSAEGPRLVFLGGRPYVAFMQDNPSEWQIEVVRLASDRHSWERVGSLPEPIPYGVDAAVVSGSLHVGTTGGWGRPLVYRLAGDGTFEEAGGTTVSQSVLTQYGDPEDGWFNRVGELNGELFAAWTGNNGNAYTSRLAGGAWQLAGAGPVGPGRDVTSVRQIGGRLYAAWVDSDSSAGLHVSRLADDGGSWVDTTSGPIATNVDHTAVLTAAGGVPYVAYLRNDGVNDELHVAKLDGAPAPIGADDGQGSGPGDDSHIPATSILPPREPRPRPARRGPCGVIHSATAGSNTLVGLASGDCLFGGAGADVLRGRGGEDRLFGGTGNDRVYGGADEDRLYGGPGADLLVGGGGWDVFHGGPGNDTIRAADGRAESIFCGPGTDTVRADRSDRPHSCERVRVVRRR